jgi:WhiB family redox-sensing transcriptional regulator
VTSGRPRSRLLDPGDAAATPPVAALSDRACNGVDPAVFFPLNNTELKTARAICNRCPHRQPCLDWAIDTHQSFGIYGATTPDERGTARRTK